MRLPLWVWLAYADVKLWFVTIPVAIALALAAWFGRVVWRALARQIGLDLDCCTHRLDIAVSSRGRTCDFPKDRRDPPLRTLDTTQTIAGLPVPAGSKVRFADKEHFIPVSVELPHVTEIGGLRLTGALRR